MLPAERVELQLQAVQVLGVFLLSYYIMQLVGVFLQVVKLVVAVAFPIEVQKLVASVAHPIVTHDVMLSRAVVVVIVEVLTPVFRLLTIVAHDGQQGCSYHLLRFLGTGYVEEGGSKVDVLHQRIALRAALHAGRT